MHWSEPSEKLILGGPGLYLGFREVLVQGFVHSGQGSEVGGANQPGNCFVSFVRAYARSECLVKTELRWSSRLFPFPFYLEDPSLFPPGNLKKSKFFLMAFNQSK